MKTRKVICVDNLPTRMPLFQTAVLYLLYDRFGATGWVVGVCGTLAVLMWLAYLASTLIESQVDILKDGKS